MSLLCRLIYSACSARERLRGVKKQGRSRDVLAGLTSLHENFAEEDFSNRTVWGSCRRQ